VSGPIRAFLLVLAGLTQWLPGAVLATVAALTAALWLWAGTAGSLRQALAIVTPLVPTLESLEWTELDATLRDGGQAERLTWQQDGLRIEVNGPRFQWQFLPLLLGQPLGLTLHTEAVHVIDQRPSNPEPLTPPDNLSLPLAVALNFDLGPVTWTGDPDRKPTALLQLARGSYTHGDSSTGGDDDHHLILTELVAAQGHYAGDVRVGSVAPLAVSAQWRGKVSSSSPHPAWDAQVVVKVSGELHGPDASLAINAEVDSPSPGPQASLQARLSPWQAQPLQQLDAKLHRLDLAAFWPGLPNTQLSGQAQAGPLTTGRQSPGNTTRWTLSAALSNGTPGPWDNGQLPVADLSVLAEGSLQAGQVSRLRVDTGHGQLSGQGGWHGNVWEGQWQALGLQLNALDTRLPSALLQGSLQAKQRLANGPQRHTSTEASLNVVANATPGTSSKDSKLLFSIKRQASISSEISWNGTQLGLPNLRATLDNASLQAQGALTPGTLAWEGSARLQAPGLQATSQGHLAAATGQGQLSLAVEDGSALARWLAGLPGLGNALGGSADALHAQGQATVRWQGGWQTPDVQLDVDAELQRLSLTATPDTPAWGAQALSLSLQGTAAHWQARVGGQLNQGDWDAQVALSLQGKTPGLTATDNGNPAVGWEVSAPQLAVTLAPRLGLAALRLESLQPVTVSGRGTSLALTAGTLRLQPLAEGQPAPPAASLGWEASTWDADGMSTAGQFSGLGVHSWAQTLARLGLPAAQNALRTAGLSGDLALQGQWQLSWPGFLTQPPQARLLIARQGGDLKVDEANLASGTDRNPRPSQAVALGISQASAELRTQGDVVTLTTQWNSARVGRSQAQWSTRLNPGPHTTPQGWWPRRSAPLNGQAQADMPDIGVWSRLAPPGWRVRGQVGLNATIGGSLGQPDWRGELWADALEVRSVVEGLAFGNGKLRASLDGDHMAITQFRLEGEGGATNGGTLELTGNAHWPSASQPGAPATPPGVSLQATAQRLRVSARADRRLTVSGQVNAQLGQSLLTLRGKLKADQAHFVLPDETAPSLGQDVVVRLDRAATPAPPTALMRTDVSLDIDLGPQFDVQGQGLQTRLTGQLTVSSPPRSDGFQILGEVRAVNGTYRAYGQPLRIEEGVLRFSGPYDDPSLDVLALRGKADPAARGLTGSTASDQQVGVKITGSARAPRVALYASPDLPDSEKLAWLVLGRPASGAGAETALLQQAALALLADSRGRGMDANLASALGLDDISVRGDSTTTSNGSTTQTAALTLGKRLSSKLYMTYEQSLSSAMGAVRLYYDVSRHLTVRAQAGQESALDLIFTFHRD